MTRGSRSVSSFFLPVFLVVVLMIVLVWVFGSWRVLESDHEHLVQGLATTAGNMAQLFEARVGGEESALKLLAQDAELIEALTAQRDVAQVQDRLKQQLPAADALLVIPANMDQDLLLKTLLGSYLALNLHERAMETGAVPAVETLKTANDSEFMIAVPIRQRQQVLGTLFARYQMDLMGNSLRQLQLGNGVIGLEQVIDGSHIVLASSPGFKHEIAGTSLPVKNTLWQIRYGVTDSAGWDELLPLSALVIIALLFIYLVFSKQQKKLALAIKADMGTALSLMDATIKGTGAPLVRPKITESAAALVLLGQQARTSFNLAREAGTGGNEVGLRMRHSRQAVEPDHSPSADELPEEIFLANDIRGVSGKTLTVSMAEQLGMAAGTLALNAGETGILVAYDARSSSDELESALVAGILSSGCDVVELGLVPAPLLYFAAQILPYGSTVMVTGGHNPVEYNGFKIAIDGKSLVAGELLALKKMVESGNLRSGTGKLQIQDLSDQYIDQVKEDIQLLEPRKVVVDGGNGAGGPLLVRLLRDLGCEVIELFCDPDGEFPNHFPDPADAENLSALAVEVQAQGADFGVALDGDGDSLALVNEKGEQVATDFLIMLLATDIIQRKPGSDVIYDVKSSGYLASYILANGGRPVMWKTGHALMKNRMRETGALLGGEYSGHLYIRDRWYGFDDAVYATARLLELFSMNSQPVSTFFSPLPKGISTRTLEVEMPGKQAGLLLQELAQQLVADAVDIIDLDGLRLEYSDGWALIRLSNTMPRLVFRFEGRDQSALENARIHLRGQIQRVRPELALPF